MWEPTTRTFSDDERLQRTVHFLKVDPVHPETYALPFCRSLAKPQTPPAPVDGTASRPQALYSNSDRRFVRPILPRITRTLAPAANAPHNYGAPRLPRHLRQRWQSFSCRPALVGVVNRLLMTHLHTHAPITPSSNVGFDLPVPSSRAVSLPSVPHMRFRQVQQQRLSSGQMPETKWSDTRVLVRLPCARPGPHALDAPMMHPCMHAKRL